MFGDTELKFIQTEISKLQDKGVIQKTQHEAGDYISPIFLTPKSDGSYRLILNLKRLNKEIPYIHFKMDTLISTLTLISKDCYMAKIDLKDAYYSVPIRQQDQKYFKFCFDGMFYKFTALPNGYGPGPRKFTKLLKPPLAALRNAKVNVSSYIDDLIILGHSFEVCVNNVLSCSTMFDKLGFVIHPEKSEFIPSQVIEYLGVIINSKQMTVTLTSDKKTAIFELCTVLLSEKLPSIRTVAKLLGKMVSSFPAVRYGKLHYRNLERCKILALKQKKGNFDAKTTLSVQAIKDVQWWQSNILHSFETLEKGNPKLTIQTDACKSGWGAVCGSKRTHGIFSESERKSSINVLELKAILFGLQSLCNNFEYIFIKILSDNTTAVNTLNNMGSCHAWECNEVVLEIWNWAVDKHIWLLAAHIPGKLNVEADFESRRNDTTTEWKLNPLDFRNIVHHFNWEPTVDLFASRINAQLPEYYSYRPDPTASVINAFSVSWENLRFYCFPPFACIPKILQKIKFDNATGLLVVPQWPNQPWFSMFHDMTIAKPLILSSRKDLLVLPMHHQEVHPLHATLKLMACLVSGRRMEDNSLMLR